MPKRGSKKRSTSPLETGGLAIAVDGSQIVVLQNAKTTWSGYIEVLDRKERIWATFRWDDGVEKFTDMECHKQLCKIAELFRKKDESLDYIILGAYQSRLIVSTDKSSLRDILFLNPPIISILYKGGERVKGFLPYYSTNFMAVEHLLTGGIGLTQIGISAAGVALTVAKTAAVGAAIAL